MDLLIVMGVICYSDFTSRDIIEREVDSMALMIKEAEETNSNAVLSINQMLLERNLLSFNKDYYMVTFSSGMPKTYGHVVTASRLKDNESMLKATSIQWIRDWIERVQS